MISNVSPQNDNSSTSKEEDTKISQIIMNRNNKSDIFKSFLTPKYQRHKLNLYDENLEVQFIKRMDGISLNYYGGWKKDLQDLAKAIKPSKKVRKIHIDCSEKWVNDRSLFHLGETFKRFHSLTSIELVFWDNNCKDITDEGLKNLGEGLKRLTSLQLILINLNGRKRVTHKGLRYLKKGLKRLTSLRSMHLDLGNCEGITDEALGVIGECFQQPAFSSLESIDFNFESCFEITGATYNCLSGDVEGFSRGFEALRKGLKRLSFLKSLKMNFEFCTELDNYGLYALSEGIKDHGSLKSIHLSFYKCKDITDEGVGYLSESLKGLNSLQSIELDFRDCYFLTDKGVNDLNKSLQGLGLLQSVCLNFRKCFSITNEYLNDLEKKFAGLKNTKIVW